LVKKLTLNTAEKIIISSSKEYLVLKDELKIPNDKILFLRNPVDLNYFYPIKRETAAEILNKDPNQKYILFVGRIVELKGIQHILNILPKLKKLYPNITLLIVGFGEYENELKKLVRKRKLENNVIFEGMIFEEKLRYYYNLADVLVLPSYAEGLPNVLLEAIACNTSCIATEVGGIPDILSDNVGILVPPKNENELFNAVKSVLDGKFSMNQRKINKILNECSLENYGEELKKVFKNIEK
jgi:glycosyltransferase involved in cell wall biosynthesis